MHGVLEAKWKKKVFQGESDKLCQMALLGEKKNENHKMTIEFNTEEILLTLI